MNGYFDGVIGVDGGRRHKGVGLVAVCTEAEKRIMIGWVMGPEALGASVRPRSHGIVCMSDMQLVSDGLWNLKR